LGGSGISEHERLTPRCFEPHHRLARKLQFALADQSELGPAAVRLLEMEADDLVLAVRPRAEPARQALVQVRPDLLRQAVVGRLLNERVFEGKRILDRGSGRIRLDQASADERHQLLAESVAVALGEQRADRAPPEVPAFHGGALEHCALGGIEPGDTGGEHGLDARG
jgi:hypothetical protein